ncbi:MAG: hypothetical protein AAF125_15895, partial [Chloroflexota bacterium]
QRAAYSLVVLAPIVLGAIYVAIYGMTFPRWDQFETTIVAVNGALNGTLTWADLTQPNYGHRIVTALATSAALAPLTDWNLLVEAFVGYGLLIGAFGATVMTLRRAETPRPWLLAVVLSVLMFSLKQRTNLIWSFTALQWFYMELFIALTGWALVTRSVGAVTLLLTGLFTALAVASSGGGVPLLVIVPLVMWLRGYLRPVHYLGWLAFAGLAFWLYSYGQAPGENTVSPLLIKPVDNFWFIVTWLSGAFIPLPQLTPRPVHLTVAGAGVALIIWNIVLISRWRGRETVLVGWLAFLVSYSAVAAGATMLGRSDIWWAGAQSRFYSMSKWFWMAVAISAVVVWIDGRMRGARPIWRRMNAVALVCMIAGTTFVNVVQFTHPTPEGLVSNIQRPRDERCYWVYLIDRSPTCLDRLDAWGLSKLVDAFDDLFARRLTLYAGYDDINPIDAIMPDVYQPGEPVVIVGPQAYQQVRGVRFTDWTVPGELQLELPFRQVVQQVPPSDLFRVMAASVPTNPALFADGVTVAPGENPTEVQLAAFREFVRFAPRVWMLRADAPDSFDASYQAILAEQHTSIPVEGVSWLTTGYEDVSMWLREPSEALRFGDDLVLEDWQMVTPVERTGCQPVEVQTMWRVTNPLPENYSLALVLADATGIGQARTDAPPAGFTTRVLEPDVHYVGTNTVELPCGMPSGDYNLLMG